MLNSTSAPPILHLFLPRNGLSRTDLLRQLIVCMQPDHGEVALRIRVYHGERITCRYHLSGCWHQPARVHATLARAFNAMTDEADASHR